MTILLIDKSGCVHPIDLSHAPALVSIEQETLPNDCKPGNVASVQFRNDTAFVRIVPDRLSYAAYATIANLLEEAAPERIVLSWHRGAWFNEIIGGSARAAWSQAGLRVLSLMTEARLDRRDRFCQTPSSINELAPNSPLRGLIELWCSHHRNIDLEKHEETVSELTNGRYCVFRSSADATLPIFGKFGPGWEIYKDRSWMNRAVGRPVTDQPDVRYGQWIAGCLRTALGATGPTLSKVEAIISDPTGWLRKRHDYTRLTLPLQMANGERALLSTPHVTSITML